VTVITAEGAQARFAELQGYYDLEGALVHYAVSTGVDLSQHDIDTPLKWRHTHSSQSLLKMVTGAEGESWKTRRLTACAAPQEEACEVSSASSRRVDGKRDSPY